MTINSRPAAAKASSRSLALRAALVLAASGIAACALAAQQITPVRNGVDIAANPVSLPAGATLWFDVQYSIDGNQTQDESGLGLLVRYDSAAFEIVAPATAVTNLLTRCLIAAPTDQAWSGSYRSIVFGWLDTALRAPPAVGWPGTADPPAAGGVEGCLNPGGIVTTTAAYTAFPLTLFRIGIRSRATFTSGASVILLTTSGNVSYAAPGNADTSLAIVVQGAAAQRVTLDADASQTASRYDALTDGLLVLRYLFGLTGAPLTSGALGGTATRTDPAAVKDYLDGIRPALDVDGNGTADALTDGLLILRYLFGLRGNALIAGAVDPLGTRTSATDIETYIQTLLP